MKAGRLISLGLVLSLPACQGATTVDATGEDVARDRPPSFVVIMADDLGASELGVYGHPEHRTPHLDRLAGEGMRFPLAYSTPLCSPTRAMIMTGRYGFRTGWYNFKGRPGSPNHADPDYDLDAAEVTFAEVLKQRGYATALAGKWQMLGELPALVREHGFDEYLIWAYEHYLPPGVEHTGRYERPGVPARFWHPSIVENGRYLPTEPDDYGPDLFADFLIDFIERHRDQPFLVYYPMALTHRPWEPAPDPTDPGGKTPKGLKPNVESMDRIVGRIVAALDRLELRESTLVIFTGDNGTQGAGKGFPTEQGARVPFIASMPGTVPRGVTSEALVDLTDILPTLAELGGAGLPEDRTIDGVSLAPTLRGEDVHHRDWIFSYLHDERILRSADWRLETFAGPRFYDCRGGRIGEECVDVTDSTDPEVLDARRRFERILEDLPAPEGLPPDRRIERRRQRFEQRVGED